MKILGTTEWEEVNFSTPLGPLRMYKTSSFSFDDADGVVSSKSSEVYSSGGVLFTGNVGGEELVEASSRPTRPVWQIGDSTFREVWYNPQDPGEKLFHMFEHLGFPSSDTNGMVADLKCGADKVRGFIRSVTDEYDILIEKIEFCSFVFYILSDIDIDGFEKVLKESYLLSSQLFGEESARMYKEYNLKYALQQAYKNKCIEIAHL